MLLLMQIAAVVASIVAIMVIEEAYYSIKPIRQAWMKFHGYGDAQVAELMASMKKAMGYLVLAAAVTAVTMMVIFSLVGVTTAKDGAVLGALFAVGFFSTVRLLDYSIAGKPKGLVLIEGGCALIEYAAIGAIIGAFI